MNLSGTARLILRLGGLGLVLLGVIGQLPGAWAFIAVGGGAVFFLLGGGSC